MLIKNVKAEWLFLNRTDDNGKYRVTFYPNAEQNAEIKKALAQCAKENGVNIKDCQWKGGYKETENGVTYTAKKAALITNKKGEEVETTPNVYNIHAQKLKPEEVPSVANGATINIDLNTYFVKSKMGKGAMLGLNGVQLLAYEVYQGGGENPFSDESGESEFSAADAGYDANLANESDVDIF